VHVVKSHHVIHTHTPSPHALSGVMTLYANKILGSKAHEIMRVNGVCAQV
jgi:hypothetical protein